MSSPSSLPFFIFLGSIITCVIVYFIVWLYCCLRSDGHRDDVDLEMGETHRRVINKPERFNEACFLSYGEPPCCDLRNPKSSLQCNMNPYCAGKLLLKIKSCVLSAKTSICVAMYNFNNVELCNFILRMSQNPRINIRILVDKSSCADGRNKQAKRLMNAGKFCIAYV